MTKQPVKKQPVKKQPLKKQPVKSVATDLGQQKDHHLKELRGGRLCDPTNGFPKSGSVTGPGSDPAGGGAKPSVGIFGGTKLCDETFG